jgi:UDP-N-acetylmuramoyl-tripeptide--D-alanyl-D-alanine ligase
MNPISIETLARILGAAITPRIGPSDSKMAPRVTGVSTDSRSVRPGDCFFAIPGEQFDGHSYVAEVFGKGAACAVVSRTVTGEPIHGPILRVPDTIQALGELAGYYRRTSGFKVVAITGSVGKTTTRQIVHHVLSRRFRTHQAQKSFNNNIGLPLTLLGAEPQTEVIVAELGSNHPGEIAYLTRIAQPDIALVTNAHPAHLEGFGSLDAIVREKLSITDGLSDDGILIINGDIEPLVAAARSLAMIRGEGGSPLRVAGIWPAIRGRDALDTKQQGQGVSNAECCVGEPQDALATRGRRFLMFGKSADVDYRAQQIACEALHSTFVIGGAQVRLPLPGPGNVENALAAWAVCDQLGVSAGEFAKAVESLHSVTMRAEPVRIGTLTVLNDCYNANPASMKNALAILHNLRAVGDGASRASGASSEGETVSRASCPRCKGEAPSARQTLSTRPRLVFICGEMAELGPQSKSLHVELGKAVAAAGVDLLVAIGDLPAVAARAALEASRDGLQVQEFADTASACDQIQDLIRKDDIILVKGSRVARLERLVEKLVKDYGRDIDD